MAHTNNYWMQKAIEQAKLGQTPYGAVIVKSDGEYITAFNTTKTDGPQAHAEMNAIRKLAHLKPYHSKDLKLYTTVEPCPMCMSALVWAGIGQLIYGASIDDAAKHGHQIHITSQDIAEKAWYEIKITKSIELQSCLKLFEMH
jgi:tRNA(Arg) A34 adenosine deaminase TadA